MEPPLCKKKYMANTYTQLLTQVVFAVKGRESLINEKIRIPLEKYICGTVSQKKHKPLAIYCMPDHLHLLIGYNPDKSLSDLVKEIKTSSGNLIRATYPGLANFHWQVGYGAISYTKSHLDRVVNYILNQPIHHSKKTFQQEYLEFLQKFEIPYEEKYLFEFYQ